LPEAVSDCVEGNPTPHRPDRAPRRNMRCFYSLPLAYGKDLPGSRLFSHSDVCSFALDLVERIRHLVRTWSGSNTSLGWRILSGLYRVVTLYGLQVNETTDSQPLLVALSLINHSIDMLSKDFLACATTD
jgi:hypothetical protein